MLVLGAQSKVIRLTYGPSSEGVTGSEGGGGRLIRVGADILRLLMSVVQAVGLRSCSFKLCDSGLRTNGSTE